MRALGVAPLLGLAASASAGTISAHLSRNKLSLPILSRSVDKRADNIFQLTAANNITGGGYFASFEIGTPPQNLNFQLDTGSSDTWVNSNEANICTNKQLQLANGGPCEATFNPGNSNTFKEVDKGGFNITYVDGTNILGDYFNDTVTIGGKAIDNQQLGLALESVRPTGLMGLGFSNNVAAKTPYPTIVDNMLSQGYINAAAFSLYLNEFESKSGSILFGGIDTKKYIGSLATLPLLGAQTESGGTSEPTSYAVQLENLSITGVTLDTLKTPAILDSGSTVSLLPAAQAEAIWSHFDVQHLVDPQTNQASSLSLVNCAEGGSKNQGLTFDFEFSGKTIKVPITEMVLDVLGSPPGSSVSPSLSSWDSVCLFGISSAASVGVSVALLGDTFLRSAYVVYDMGNNQLALAQSNVGTTESNIVEFAKNAKDIPSSSGVEAQESAVGQLTPPTALVSVLAVGMAIAVAVTDLL